MTKELTGVRNEYGLTVKQERFAQGIAKGLAQSEAYREAFDAENMKPDSIYSEASRLMNNPSISARVRALLEKQEEAMFRDGVRIRRHVVKRLLDESEDFDKGTAMSRIRAAELLGKMPMVGLFTQAPEDGDKDKTPEDLQRELMDKLRSLFKG